MGTQYPALSTGQKIDHEPGNFHYNMEPALLTLEGFN